MTEGPVGRHVTADVTHTLLAPPVDPVVTIRSGETIVVETIDAFGGQISEPGDRRDRTAMPLSNYVSGPIAVAESEPGDCLRVEVLEIESANGKCASYLWPYDHVSAALGPEHEHQTRICTIADGVVHWDDRLDIPFHPMIGVVATAPAEQGITSEDAGDFGGNLDLAEVRPGSVVWLPVQRPGGLLTVGDCHASQGDGEIGGAALEMAAHVTLRVHLEKSRQLDGPRVATGSELLAVAVGLPLEETVSTAYGRLARWVEQDYGISRFEAYLLLTMVGRVSLGYVGLGVAGAAVSRELVATLAARQSG